MSVVLEVKPVTKCVGVTLTLPLETAQALWKLIGSSSAHARMQITDGGYDVHANLLVETLWVQLNDALDVERAKIGVGA